MPRASQPSQPDPGFGGLLPAALLQRAGAADKPEDPKRSPEEIKIPQREYEGVFGRASSKRLPRGGLRREVYETKATAGEDGGCLESF